MNILVVDNNEKICKLFSDMIKKEGYFVRTANNGCDAIRLAKEENPNVIFLDIKMPDLSGIEVLKEIKKANPDTTVIMITGYSTMRFLVEAMKLGAYDCLAKPVRPDNLKAILKKLKAYKDTRKDAVSSVSPEVKEELQLNLINGRDPGMLEIYKTIGKVANAKSAVLIRGESGTGKELVARALHFSGSRKDKPFMAIDCASLSPTLLESELFGHEKGSFTGSVGRKIGKIEAADGGTLFLDEIGNLAMEVQAKLLRVLQEKQIVRVGANRPIEVDIRIIAATNWDLALAMREGGFKPDLYYRLNVVSINIPPLRERKEDIPLLVDYVLEKIRKDGQSAGARSISKEVLDLMTGYDWPGNVRELENVMERAVVTGKDRIIWPEDLPRAIREHGAQNEKDLNGTSSNFHLDAIEKGIPFNQAKNRFEKDVIREALRKTNGSMKEAAGILNMSPRSLRYMVKKHGLKTRSEEPVAL